MPFDVIIKMNIDKFGRSDTPAKAAFSFRCSSAASIPKTRDGNYDMANLKLCNVGSPTLPEDAATKSYIDKQVRDESHDIRGEILLSKRINAERMVRFQSKTIEEIGVKYDEKFKSLWAALGQMNALVGETAQGLSTALDAFPHVEDALNTLATQISENVTAIRQEIADRMNQSAAELRINDEDLKNKIQSELRVYIAEKVKHETDQYGDRVEIAIASANTVTKERLELEQRLQKKFDDVINNIRLWRADCTLWHQEYMSTKSSTEDRLASVTNKAEKGIEQISDSLNQLGAQLTALEQALRDQGIYTADPRKRSLDG